MALVHESISDFILFPRDQTFYDSLHSSVDDFVGLDCSFRNSIAMQQAFQDRGLALLGDPSDPPGYPSGQPIYFNAPDLIVDAPKGHARQYQQRYTPSGSPSPSVPHSLDQPPSTLSSTSGASGPSTASSTVGSPYSLATHSLSGPDAWSELNQGLGIAPDIVHNESFTQDAFPNGSLEGELCYQDGKFADNFVGEYGKISSVRHSQRCSTSAPSLSSENNSTFLQTPFSQSPPNFFRPSAMVRHAPGDTLRPSTISAVYEHTEDPDNSDQFLPFAISLSGRNPLHSPATSDMDSPGSETFKPPVKPASAMGPLRRQPPLPRRQSAPWDQTRGYQPSNPLFNQSNGRFIAPLESSCRFSLSCFVFHISLTGSKSCHISLRPASCRQNNLLTSRALQILP